MIYKFAVLIMNIYCNFIRNQVFLIVLEVPNNLTLKGCHDREISIDDLRFVYRLGKSFRNRTLVNRVSNQRSVTLILRKVYRRKLPIGITIDCNSLNDFTIAYNLNRNASRNQILAVAVHLPRHLAADRDDFQRVRDRCNISIGYISGHHISGHVILRPGVFHQLTVVVVLWKLRYRILPTKLLIKDNFFRRRSVV